MIAIDDRNFKRLTEFIQKHYGINLTQKRTLIEGRLSNLLTAKGINNFSKYLDEVFKDASGSEITELLNRLTTNLTYFMREPDHFNYFVASVLPWIEQTVKNRDVRIWSAGCSTGEEPYTLAMLINEYFQNKKIAWDTKVLATDISKRALSVAEKGIYSSESLKSLPSLLKLRYFSKFNLDDYKVKPEIKNEVIFAPFNLMENEFPFKKQFHVIFCRNVMIYFDKATKGTLIEKFYEATEPGGYLFIGHSESIERNSIGYKYVMPSLYRKV